MGEITHAQSASAGRFPSPIACIWLQEVQTNRPPLPDSSAIFGHWLTLSSFSTQTGELKRSTYWEYIREAAGVWQVVLIFISMAGGQVTLKLDDAYPNPDSLPWCSLGLHQLSSCSAAGNIVIIGRVAAFSLQT